MFVFTFTNLLRVKHIFLSSAFGLDFNKPHWPPWQPGETTEQQHCASRTNNRRELELVQQDNKCNWPDPAGALHFHPCWNGLWCLLTPRLHASESCCLLQTVWQWSGSESQTHCKTQPTRREKRLGVKDIHIVRQHGDGSTQLLCTPSNSS